MCAGIWTFGSPFLNSLLHRFKFRVTFYQIPCYFLVKSVLLFSEI